MPIFTYLSKATVSALSHVIPTCTYPTTYPLKTSPAPSAAPRRGLFGITCDAFRVCAVGDGVAAPSPWATLTTCSTPTLSQPGRLTLPTTPTLCPPLPTCSTL